ncbi:MAG: AbrB family transcriptional regulator [Acidianus hospitalis]
MEKSLYFSYQFILVKLDKKVDFIYPKELGINLMLDEFYISAVPEGILLVPRVKDPIKVLEEEGKKLPQNLSIEELKRKALEEAEKEIGLR